LILKNVVELDSVFVVEIA